MTIRVHKLAKELGFSSKELVAKLKELKVEVKGHMSALDDETAEIIRHELEGVSSETPPKPSLKLPVIQVKIPLTVKELSVKLSIKPGQLIKKMMEQGVFATINQSLAEDIVKKVAKDFGYEAERLPTSEESLLRIHDEKEDKSKLVPRPPVVTFMGHVDHGKTSLLDMIRKTRVTEGEKGGITQHIGAYEVVLDKGRVTFLDTPGHEAFTAMRARGAHVTDIVVLVVAADDGIMPQTVEAVDHARAANVPIVVAINKCDLPNVDIEGVKREMGKLDLTPEAWGGKTIMVNVSAKTGQGIDELLEMLLLEAEMLELKANPQRLAKGIIVEGRLSRGGGPTVTVLVQNGTLKAGDVVVSGLYYGKIKAMRNDRGQRIKQAGPSDPVEIIGLSGVPEAGDFFYVVADEKKAREFSLERLNQKRESSLGASTKISLEDLYEQIQQGNIKELKMVAKADVQGSLEALLQSLHKLSTKDVNLRVIHSGVGNVNESDIMLAAASNAVVVGFHVSTEPRAQKAEEKEGIDVRLYEIIYEAVEDIKAAMEGLLEPILEEVVLGKAEVRQVFKVSKIGTIAGSMVTEGKINRDAQCRLIREGEEVFKGKVTSLKRFKEDAKDVARGFECGIGLSSGYNDIKQGDIVQCFVIKKVARRL